MNIENKHKKEKYIRHLESEAKSLNVDSARLDVIQLSLSTAALYYIFENEYMDDFKIRISVICFLFVIVLNIVWLLYTCERKWRAINNYNKLILFLEDNLEKQHDDLFNKISIPTVKKPSMLERSGLKGNWLQLAFLLIGLVTLVFTKLGY
ncbi:MAG: hypothetical protein ABJF04_08535 [Reichenbachiella sp.]|uniref:hypothetical protein n=1 Tax=Reichenbachiella sp. TaxID=2184521 RepID=UPI003266863A